MSIYLVKVFNDVSSSYQGIDDIEIYPCSTEDKAIEKLHEIFDSKVKYFKEEYDMCLKQGDLSCEIVDGKHFCIHNERDFFSGQIVEKEVI